jgi:hypothetical protein
MNANFISPTGSIELDNDCTYSIDKRNVRSREVTIPTEDLPIYFKEYIEPKYGLENINVNNVASFMKDLEMNWTKLTPDLKDKVLNIMVDFIFNNPKSDYDFKTKFLEKLNIRLPEAQGANAFRNISNSSFQGTNEHNKVNSKSMFGNIKESFGSSDSGNVLNIIMIIAIVCLLIFLYMFNKK